MHKIVSEYPQIRDAQKRYDEAMTALLAYQGKVDAARAKQAAEVQGALDRGEVLVPPLEVVPDDAVKAHLEGRLRAAEAERDGSWSGTARHLVPALEARERELLADVLKRRAESLQPLVDEVLALIASKSELLRRQRKALQGMTYDGLRAAVTFAPIPEHSAVTPGALVDAALTGGTLIGQSAHAADLVTA